MALSTPTTVEDLGRPRVHVDPLADPGASQASAASWSAILAGAAASAALSLILLMLGVGLGMSVVSPWANEGVEASTFGIATILWLSFTALAASGMGGYLAGRLRTRWIAVHSDEVYFRDTVHGFLAWAIATLATVTVLTSAVGSIVGTGVQAGAAVAGGAATSATAAMGGAAGSAGTASSSDDGPMAYFVDLLFRRDASAPASTSAAAPASAQAGGIGASPGLGGSADFGDGAGQRDDRSAARDAAEVGRIFMNADGAETLPPEDARHAGQIVAQRTGLSQPEAERRVAEVYTRAQTQMRDAEAQARETADEARRASAHGALWIFVSLLIGAFSASLAATWGGRRRDR